MNPIHESGFASLVVLFFAVCPAGLSALIALALCWKRPRGAIVAANATVLLGALVCLLAAVTTMKLHSSVDYWIDTGGYGPPAQVRAQYGAEWHSSARLTALAGLFFTALPFAISGIVYALVRRKNPEMTSSANAVLIFAAVAIVFCLLMAIL